jgi:hypothetical protein
MMKRLTSVVLAVLLSVPNGSLLAATNPGTVEGKVTLGQRPLSGVQIALVDVKSGAVVRVTTDSAGRFRAAVPAGQYVVTTENGLGLSVAKGPTLLGVQSGAAAQADLELVAVATTASHGAAQDAPPAAPSASQATINHDPIGCFIAGQFPLVDAIIEPASSVARARVYFKAAKFDAFYYVEMVPAEKGFVGKLPRPKLEASPITYYVQATTTEFGETQTPEYEAIVVEDEKDCPGKRVAPIGPPGEVTVFSSSTGLAAGLPAGFAAGAGLLSGGILVGAIILGAATAGVVGAVVIGGDTTTTTTTTTTSTTSTTSSTTSTVPTTTTTLPISPFR